ncbi:MAG TPA: hypothetical protein VIM73_08510 [Polyangiaceae bacterium]
MPDPVKIERQPVETADGGFYMDFAQSVEGHTSQALRVSYAWSGSKGEVNAVSAGGSWRVNFPDKPKPDEVASLELEYTFPLSDAEKNIVREKFRTVARVYIDAAVAASAEIDEPTAFQEELTARLQALAPLLNDLKKYGNSEKTGGGVTLDELGLTRTAGGDIALAPAGTKRLFELASQHSAERDWSRLEEKIWTKLPRGAACQGKTLNRDAPQPELTAVLDACFAELNAALKAAAEAYAAAVPEVRSAETNLKQAWDAFEVARVDLAKLPSPVSQSVREGDTPGETTLAVRLGTVTDTYQGLVDAARKQGARVPAFGPDELPSFNATRWAMLRWGLNERLKASTDPIANALTQRTLTLTQQQLGSVLLERSAVRRYWDVATGTVYIGEVDDTAIPAMLAFCPATCLRRGETMWGNDFQRFANGLSFDVGARVGVYDKNTDARHLDRPGFFVGGSLNPFYFFRASAGMYMFENAQTERWNQTWYVGATINVVHAAEMLGPLGLMPAKLDAEEKKEEDE